MARPHVFDTARALRARRKSSAQLVTAALLGAAVAAGLVYAMTQRRRGRHMGPTVRRLRENVADYVGSARQAIDAAVEAELKDLRRSIRRQRKRFGV